MKLSLEVRALAQIHVMQLSIRRYWSIAEISAMQRISKPMARRVFLHMRKMQILTVAELSYRGNTTKYKFCLVYPLQLDAVELYLAHKQVQANRIERFMEAL